MSRHVACLFALSLLACAAAPSAAELRLMARNPEGVRSDDPAWLARLSEAGGVPVRFAAAISPRRASYLIACAPRNNSCEDALSRLRASGLLEELEIEGRKTVPVPPASTTLH